MKNKRSFLCLLIALVLMFSLAFMVTACDEDNSTETTDVEFVFEGEQKFVNGVNYNIVITGYKDTEKSIKLTVKEMPIMEMSGTWAFVEGKGYKLYLDDSGGTYVYSSYDTSTNLFTAKVPVNLGGGFGTATVTMTYKDVAFASAYDGEGLPPHPPTFTGYGVGGTKGTTRWECSVICREDGTCVAVTDKTGIPNREGTYVYDSTANTYTFEFADETAAYGTDFIYKNSDGVDCYWHNFGAGVDGKGSLATTEYLLVSDGIPHYNTSTWYYDKTTGEKVETPYVTTYDEATKTYTLVYEAYCRGFTDRIVTYTLDD